VLFFLALFDLLAFSGRLRLSGSFILGLGLAVTFLRWVPRREASLFRVARGALPALLGITLLLFLGIEGASAYAERRATRSLPAAAPGSPNVLLIVLDTVRSDHTSLYGYSRHTTPNLERIAREGVTFEQAFSTSCWTLPAHATLLTGHEAHEHGAEYSSYDGRFPTLAHEFLHRGYQTAAFSANTIWFSRRRGLGGGFLHFEDVFGSSADKFARTLYGRMVNEYLLPRLHYNDTLGRKRAADVSADLLRWLDHRRTRPFFAVLNYYDAHDPYRPPQPFRSMFSKLPDPGGLIFELAGRLRLADASKLQGEIDAYDGAIAYMDDQIGHLFAQLDARGLLENTCVVILSDHGEFLGEHGLYVHRNALYRMGIQVPLIFHWKGHIPAGVRVAEPAVSLTEVAATLMELLPARSSIAFPGPSLAPLWRGAGSPADYPHPLARLAQFSFALLNGIPSYAGASLSVVSPEWHYMLHEATGDELYNWRQDSGEQTNLRSTAQGQPLAREFHKEAERRGALPFGAQGRKME
jgi:arylsulfatase A-like enzyme